MADRDRSYHLLQDTMADRDRTLLSTAITSLHEGLFARSLLQHRKAADVSRRPVDASVKPPIETWDRFLDELCQLCQLQKGAENTTAIAAEASKDEPTVVFWLASNTGQHWELQGTRDKRKNHLEWILNNLKKLARSAHWEKQGRERDASEIIFRKSVAQSKDKISNYQSRLQLFVKHVVDLLKDGCQEGKEGHQAQKAMQS
jgi:hypothetical protein